jgi:sugar/nucleoside kinase (ribokinase family)
VTGDGGILCAGRIYCDLVFSGLDGGPVPGREVFADRLALRAGGGAYITAAYLSALGCDVGLMGVLPAPPFTVPVTQEMAQNRVTSHCTDPAPADDPQITVALAHGGDRAFVTRRCGAALVLQKGAALPAARHLHIGELTTALDHPDLIGAARGQGMTISLDCSWDTQALADPRAPAVIASVDLFLPNSAEAEALRQNGIAVAPRVASIVKRGNQGAVAIAAGGATQSAPACAATVQDTTGAGDAFNAGFLSAWLAGRPLAECLARANHCGALAVARLGGAGHLPDLRELVGDPVQVPGVE